MSDMTETIRPFSAASFNKYLSERKLMAARCTACGSMHLPPRAICPNCHSESMEWVETGGKGKLAGFTVVYVAPNFMLDQGFGRDKPYVSGIVDLAEGIKISARITGVDATRPETIRVGMPVSVDFVDAGEGDKKITYLAFAAG